MKRLLILAMIGIIAACAASSQDAVISIYPKVNPSNIGAGIPLSISVEDSRSTGVIGTFGDGGQISTSQDMAMTMGIALVDSFSKMGFNVRNAGSTDAVHMHVFLEDLHYTMEGGTITTNVETNSRVRVEAVNKGFNRTYSNSEERKIPFSSNPATNNSQLSNTLNTTVQRIVSDNDLIAALKQ